MNVSDDEWAASYSCARPPGAWTGVNGAARSAGIQVDWFSALACPTMPSLAL